MALTGTLSDVAIVALLQFPNTGKRSGLVTVDSEGRTARFYYDAGKLVHAQLEHFSGEEVIVQVVDWTAGNFTFEPDVKAPAATIEKDLHRCIMWALKERDERKNSTESPAQEGSGILSKALERLVSESETFVYVAILDEKGKALCSSGVPGKTGEVITGLQRAVSMLLAEYPGRVPKRLIVDDERFSMISEAIRADRVLLAVAEPGTRMGILPLAAARIVEGLEEVP
jgi:hypothetical protein